MMKKELEKFDGCLQHEISFCSASCPYNLDVTTFISRIQEGRFNAAYKAYRDATGFPAIAAEICSENCKEACLRNAVKNGAKENPAGQPIELHKLEKACLEYSTRKDPVSYNIPSKNRSIAIIGGGISGIACAMRMATKKYNVTVFEMTDRIGGHLLDTMDSGIVEADFALQMQNLNYEIKFDHKISSIEDVIEIGYKENQAAAEKLKAQSAVASVMRSSTTNSGHAFEGTYDAIYVATGSKGSTFGFDINEHNDYDGPCTLYKGHNNNTDIGGSMGESNQVAVFFGGSLTGADSTHALADGLRIATAIDNYILSGVLKYPVYPSTEIAIDETRYVESQAVKTATDVYAKDEAIEESKRCMKCQCNACRLHCDLTEYVHKWPLRLRDEIVATTAPGKSELHATPAVRLINSCTHCGLCKDTCPADIDMDTLIQKARIRMHQLGKMPWAFNDFFLRDMYFTLNEAHLCQPSDDNASETAKSATCRYAFFPGCQFGASSPETVLKSYEYLKSHEPSTGIILSCCGIPALWAGDEELYNEVLQKIRDDWNALGKPVLILACPTCCNNFRDYLPEIETVFIYDLLAEWGIDDTPAGLKIAQGRAICEETCSIFDPCSTRDEDPVRQSVRQLCLNLGLVTEALPVQEKWSACCGYGGHGAVADPQFTGFVRENRVSESANPYITYCINCRDSFMHEGKNAPHILNIIFDVEPSLDTWTKRRDNRIWLKKQIMKTTDCDANSSNSVSPIGDLIMGDSVRQKLSDEYILENEVLQVIEFCQRTGRTFLNTETDTYTGYHKIGNMTYWVEYRITDSDTFELINAYSHRMTIDLEMVWNGKKVEIDV